MGYIYMLTDIRNGEKYIGKHNGTNSNYWSGGLIPNRIANKYGKEVFERVIIEDGLSIDIIDDREKYYITLHNTIQEGYNISEGGDGGDTISNHPNKSEITKKISESLKKSNLPQKNKERGRLKRLGYIKSFIKDLEDGLIGPDNVRLYGNRLWKWRKELTPKEFNTLLPENIIEKFYELRETIRKKSHRENANKHIGYKHTKESMEKMSISKIKVNEKKKKDFLEYCNNVYETMNEKGLEYLIECYNKDEYTKIRSKIKNSVFLSHIPEHISNKILNLKPKKKEVKNTNPNKFYGNKNKEVIINGIIYSSVSDASSKLNIDRGTIRYRLRNIKNKEYIYK